jgi:sugar lactone lactonase YvrE
LPHAAVALVDAAGHPLLDGDGKPLTAVSDDNGVYAFRSHPAVPAILQVQLPGDAGRLQAFCPDTASQVDLDGPSTLVVGYVLERYVKGDAGTLAKLPEGLEAHAREQAERSLASGAAAVPDALTPARVAATVQDLRKRDAGFDFAMEQIQRALEVGGSAAVTDGAVLAAQIQFPSGLVADGKGALYVADTHNQLIRKVDFQAGTVTTLAGSGQPGSADGRGAAASFKDPAGLALDAAGNLYVADAGNSLIRRVTPDGTVTTLPSDGLDRPAAVAVDGDRLLVADTFHNRLAVLEGGKVTTLAGGAMGSADGLLASATFSAPQGLALDGTTLYVSEANNNLIRKVDLKAGTVATLAGTRDASSPFFSPAGLALDGAGGLLVADALHARVQRVDLATGAVKALAEGLGYPLAVATGGYVADATGNVIKRIGADGQATTVVGSGKGSAQDGSGDQALFNVPTGLALAPDGAIYVADARNNQIRRLANGAVTTVAGSGAVGGADGPAAAASFFHPTGVAVAANGDLVVADYGNHKLRRIAGGTVSTIAGTGTQGSADGPVATAQLAYPQGVAVGKDGQIYVADSFNHAIRALADGQLRTLAGSGTPGSADGQGAKASFTFPQAIAAAPDGNLYVADTFNGLVRRVAPDGTVGTLQGATFAQPNGLVVDGEGHLYVADGGRAEVRRLDLGQPGPGTPVTGAAFIQPMGLALDAAGLLYVSDATANKVWALKP